jgi:hypothetical protein
VLKITPDSAWKGILRCKNMTSKKEADIALVAGKIIHLAAARHGHEQKVAANSRLLSYQ